MIRLLIVCAIIALLFGLPLGEVIGTVFLFVLKVIGVIAAITVAFVLILSSKN